MNPQPLRQLFRLRANPGARALWALLILAPAAAAPLGPAKYSEPALLAPRSLLLDGVAIDGKLVVVGARGHILVSVDRGAHWKQMPVPTRATLNAAHFVNDRVGYVAGHDAVILKTEDGGSTWSRVHYAPDEERPLFDIWFGTPERGIAVGAYGYYLETKDGGRTWTDRVFQPIPMPAENGEAPAGSAGEQVADDLHLYRIVRTQTDKLFIAAEAGAVYRSDDDGQTWLRLPSPYEGSFFGIVPMGGDALLLFGLEGRIFRSEDAGVTWEEADSGTEAILMDGVQLDDGSIVVVGFAGSVLRSTDGGRTFEVHVRKDRAGLAAILPSEQDSWVLIGENGVRVIGNPWAPTS